MDVSKHIQHGNGSDVKLLVDNIKELQEYVPFTIKSRLDTDNDKNGEDNVDAVETEEEELCFFKNHH